jgi:hypothetical protein
MQVLACVAFDAGGTCTSQVWVDPPTVLPTLTIAQANTIGLAVCSCVVLVRLVRLLEQAWSDRG